MKKKVQETPVDGTPGSALTNEADEAIYTLGMLCRNHGIMTEEDFQRMWRMYRKAMGAV